MKYADGGLPNSTASSYMKELHGAKTIRGNMDRRSSMRNLLSDWEIQSMSEEIKAKADSPFIDPPKGREMWSVNRIVATLEYFQTIEKKFQQGSSNETV